MAESNPHKSPPHASLDELVEFFETHDMGDYLEQMPMASFDVNLKRRVHLVEIDEEIASRLDKIAKVKQIPAESLVNLWLKEKILGYEEKAE
jgi:hypothetical protein